MEMKCTRRVVQFAFLAATLVGVFAFGANCEMWCPFGGVEAIYEYVNRGTMVCSLGISNFYALAGVLVLTLLARRAFCGYICPIGTISEWLNVAAQKTGIPRRLGLSRAQVPPALDRVLGLMKYAVLAAILYFTWRAGELIFRGFDPCYALISRHGTDITVWAYVVAGTIVAASLLIMLPFCRWFCPLAAVLGPFSRLSFFRVRRDVDNCIDCGCCARACPTAIPVDRLKEVTAARCISCLQCVDACSLTCATAGLSSSAKMSGNFDNTAGQAGSGTRQNGNYGALTWGPPAILGGNWPRGLLAAVVLLCVTTTVAATYLYPLPSFVKSRGVEPPKTASVDLVLENLSCRGRANLLFYFLERDDMFALSGYFRLEAWPGPGEAKISVYYDPSQCDERRIKEAVTEPYFELDYGWRQSPFAIKGYDMLGSGFEPMENSPQ